MLEGFLGLLQSPEFQTFVATYAAAKLLDTSGSKIKQLKDQSREKTPEWQFLRCLDLAFIATEKELGWDHTTDAIYDIFEDSLLTHHGSFTVDSLKEIYEAAVSHSVSISDLEVWVRHFKREFAMGDFKELEKFFNIDHYFQTSSTVKSSEPKYILTRNGPMCENPDIIFRDTIVKDLLDKVSVAASRVQIAGMGGLGKTEILNKLYAQLAKDKHHTLFDHIALITFSGEIASDIEAQIDYPSPYCGQQGVEAAKRYLQDVCQEKRVLLCIDDIRPDQTILKKDNPSLTFLKSLGASVLLAARVTYPEFEVLDLHFLPTEACISIFKKQYGQAISDADDIAILTDIIENRAGNHTMIVNRLGTMARDYMWSISTLSEKLKDKNFNFSKGIADDELLQQEINKLYQINEKLTPAEVIILEAFSIFPASPLSIDLCVDWLHEDAGVDEDKCALLLNKLAEQTWLEKRCDCESNNVYFLMHQLVRTAVQEQLTAQYSSHQNLVASCATNLDESSEKYHLQFTSSMIPFALSVYDHLFQELSPLANLSTAIANFYYKSAEYLLALEWYQKALSLFENSYGKECLATAFACDRLAMVYYRLGDYSSATEEIMLAMHTCEKLSGYDSLQIASLYSNQGTICESMGDYLKAEDLFQKALNIKEKKLGKKDLVIANTYTNLGVVCYHQSEYHKSLKWHKKALAILKAILGETHLETAGSYCDIASVYLKLNKTSTALNLYLKALSIYERVLGKEHPDTASIYGGIACVYYDQKDYSSALLWFEKELKVYECKFGTEHPDTATSYNNLGAVSVRLQNTKEAFFWYTKAKTVREKLFDAGHPSTATTYSGIGGVFEAIKDYASALHWHLLALDLSRKLLGENHLDTGKRYKYVANTYLNIGNIDSALECYVKAEKVYIGKLGATHPETISVQKTIGILEKLISKQFD